MHRPFLRALLAVALLLAGCSAAVPERVLSVFRPSLNPVPVADAGTVTFLASGGAVRDLVLSDPQSQELWQQKRSMFPAGGAAESWLSQFTASTSGEPVPVRGLIRLAPDEKWVGRLLLSNGRKTPQEMAVIFLLDYQPLRVEVGSRRQNAYYVPEMPPGAEEAFAFTFPPLNTGLHHLSLLLIGDPHSPSTEDAALMAQQSLFSEQRFDLWVGIDRLPVDVPTFADQEQTRAALQASTPCNLVRADQPRKLLLSLELRAGTEGEIVLRFQKDLPQDRPKPADFALPLKVGVIWDERLASVADYTLHPPYGEELTLNVPVSAPGEPGLHHVQVVAFVVPEHAQFDAAGQWIAYGHSMFTYRVPVTVTR